MISVEMESVGKTYSTKSGPIEAVRHFSVSVSDGEFVSILGPSGCGKSTILGLVAGLIMPSKGEISVGGKSIRGPYTDLGFVFQDALLLDWRDALGNIMIQVEARKLPKESFRDNAADLLARVGLAGFEGKMPWELSGGMRQRVALCRALVHDPPLVLMDEPFGPLDALTREHLMLDLRRLWLEAAPTILFVTHSIDEAVFLSDRVVVMTPRPGEIRQIIDIRLDRRRTLESRATPEFARHSKEIHQLFQDMGLFGGDQAPSSESVMFT